MKRLLLDAAGATAVEYALLATLIAVALYQALYATNEDQAETYGTISSTLSSANGPGGSGPADPRPPGPRPAGTSPRPLGDPMDPTDPMDPMGPMGPTSPMGPMGPMGPVSPMGQSGPLSVPGGADLPADQLGPMAGGGDPSRSNAMAPGAPNQAASTPQT